MAHSRYLIGPRWNGRATRFVQGTRAELHLIVRSKGRTRRPGATRVEKWTTGRQGSQGRRREARSGGAVVAKPWKPATRAQKRERGRERKSPVGMYEEVDTYIGIGLKRALRAPRRRGMKVQAQGRRGEVVVSEGIQQTDGWTQTIHHLIPCHADVIGNTGISEIRSTCRQQSRITSAVHRRLPAGTLDLPHAVGRGASIGPFIHPSLPASRPAFQPQRLTIAGFRSSFTTALGPSQQLRHRKPSPVDLLGMGAMEMPYEAE